MLMIVWCTADLEEMKQQALVKKKSSEGESLVHQIALTVKLRNFEHRCEEMKVRENAMMQQNAADRRQFEIEKEEAPRLLDEAKFHADHRKCKQQDAQKEIIKKHEDENKELEMDVQSK